MTSNSPVKRTKDTITVHISRELVKQARVHTAQMGLYGARAAIEQALTEFFARQNKKTGKAA